MKKLCTLLIFLCLVVPLRATEQMPERLVIDGKEYFMQYLPLDDLDTRLQQEIQARLDTVSRGFSSTALWRGYVGYWSISNDNLYLDSLCTPAGWDEAKLQEIWRAYDYATLCEILADYCHAGRIRADWVTRDSISVFAPDWELLSYAHIGFSARFDKQILCSFRKGLLQTVSYKNFLFHSGVRWKENQHDSAIASQFPYDQYPQLKGRGYVYVYIYDIEVDENGRMSDCRPSLGGTALRDLAEADTLADQLTAWVKQKILSVDWQLYQVDGTYTLGLYPTKVSLNFGRPKNH